VIDLSVVQVIGLTLDNHRIQTRIRLVSTWAFLISLSLMSVVWLLVMNVGHHEAQSMTGSIA
jgi:hypothetical protein